MGLMIAGVSSGSGKTTLTIGLMRALKNRGVKVAAFKAGPDYIDPMFHRLAVQEASYNLPSWMVTDDTLKYLYEKRSRGQEFSIIEGVMGYFDGHSFETIEGSSAHLAEVLGIGVVIVMDASHMALTAAALIEGLMHFHTPNQIKGVIFNKVSSISHFESLKNAIEQHLNIKCYGYLKPSIGIQIESRHLGLIQAQENINIEDKIEKIAALVTETVDLDSLLYDFKNAVDQTNFVAYDSIGCQASLSKIRAEVEKQGGLRLGIAKDNAFSFYYDENIETLRECGVTLIPFSPIYDHQLPDAVDAIYLGGGYPEVFAKVLSDNQTMRESIKTHARAGMPIYAECGGLMYLMKTLKNMSGEVYEMVGIFDGHSKMTNRLQHFGHVDAHLQLPIKNNSDGVRYRGHEFHQSVVETNAVDCIIEVIGKKDTWQCGYHAQNVLGTYVHNHFYSNLDFLEWLIHFLSQTKAI